MAGVDKAAVLAMRMDGEPVRVIAETFGVTASRIYQVLDGWKQDRTTEEGERGALERAFRREVRQRYWSGEGVAKIAQDLNAPFAKVHLIVFDEKRALRERLREAAP